jgi:hypothetical protein
MRRTGWGLLGAVVLSLVVALPAVGAPGAVNLTMSASVRESLLKAGAAAHDLPARDYLGLAHGTAYYAYDAQNHTFYAAASLVPSPHSMRAEVGAQDDGAYDLFTRPAHSNTWKVYADGLTGSDGATCPLTIPETVRRVWGWTRACQPPDAV